jgi:hypothetical protein
MTCRAQGSAPLLAHELDEPRHEPRRHHLVAEARVEGEVVQQPQDGHHEHRAAHRHEFADLADDLKLHSISVSKIAAADMLGCAQGGVAICDIRPTQHQSGFQLNC